MTLALRAAEAALRSALDAHDRISPMQTQTRAAYAARVVNRAREHLDALDAARREEASIEEMSQ